MIGTLWEFSTPAYFLLAKPDMLFFRLLWQATTIQIEEIPEISSSYGRAFYKIGYGKYNVRKNASRLIPMLWLLVKMVIFCSLWLVFFLTALCSKFILRNSFVYRQ